MIATCRHALDERCMLCVSDTEFETAMANPNAAPRIASTGVECPTWLPEVAA